MSDIYPNAPLYEVDFEMRFDGETAIDVRKDKYQSIIRDRYPNLLIPNSIAGQAYDLIPYSFRSDDDDNGVFLSIAQFGVFTKDYKDFKSYSEYCRSEVESFLSVFPEVKKINRFGLRYNNAILFDRNSELEIPLFKLLNINFENKSIPNIVHDFEFKYNFMVENGMLSLFCRPARIANSTQESISFDIDFFRIGTFDISESDRFLEEAHIQIKKIFEGVVTDNYREQMKGNYDE